MPHSKLYLVQNLKFSLASKRQNIFQLDTSVAEFHGVLPEKQIFLSHALDDKKIKQKKKKKDKTKSTLFKIILCTFVTVIIHKDNFF